MTRTFIYFTSLFLILGLYSPDALFAKERLAFMDLKAEHRIDKALAQAFSTKIREEIRKVGVLEVLDKKHLKRTAKKTDPGCEDTPCLIKFGRTVGTKYLAVGSLSKLGSTYYVDLRVINTEDNGPIIANVINEKYRCTENELFGKAPSVAALIMGKKRSQVKTSGRQVSAPKLKAGPEKITNTFGMEFVLIPHEVFMMGSPEEEPDRSDDEKLHSVAIERPFYIQTTEVTQGQWERVMGGNPSQSKECGRNCPVENVSWDDAQEFIKRLNEIEGTDKYRLPTEAEWEYSARAGTTTPFNMGKCISTEEANFNGLKPQSGCPEGVSRKRTVKVKSFQPNAWGLYDVHGNVWEWCHDRKKPYPGDLETLSPDKGRVLRGGSFLDGARNLRSARRFMYAQDYRDYDIGFRVVKDL